MIDPRDYMLNLTVVPDVKATDPAPFTARTLSLDELLGDRHRTSSTKRGEAFSLAVFNVDAWAARRAEILAKPADANGDGETESVTVVSVVKDAGPNANHAALTGPKVSVVAVTNSPITDTP